MKYKSVDARMKEVPSDVLEQMRQECIAQAKYYTAAASNFARILRKRAKERRHGVPVQV